MWLPALRPRDTRLPAVAAALLASVVTLAGCGGGGGGAPASAGSGDAASLPTIRVVLVAVTDSVPMWVGHDKGFFKKHGIRVDISNTNDLSSIIPALGRQYDVGFGIQPVTIMAASKGIDVVQVSGNTIWSAKAPTMYVLSRPDSGILKPADLVGKSLGAPTITGNINFGTEYWLKQQGVDISKIQFRQVNTPQMPDQLKAGMIDAAEVQEPYAQILLSQGYHNVGYPLQAVGDPCYMGAWVASRQWAQAHRSEIKALKAALAEADDWIASNAGGAKDVIAKYTGLQRDLLEKSRLSGYATTNTPETLQQWDPVLRSVGNFTEKVDYGKIVFNP